MNKEEMDHVVDQQNKIRDLEAKLSTAIGLLQIVMDDDASRDWVAWEEDVNTLLKEQS
jgi:hypothetical protein